MSDLPLVSVLMSSYNHERYVRDSIISVLEQTYPHIELIVMDDGSKDRTPDIIRELVAEYADSDKRIVFTAKTNSGLSDTLNQCLAQATGKYICQLGSDDLMPLDKTAKQVAFMEENPDVAVSGGNALNIDSDGVIIDKRQRFPPRREITFEHLFANTGPGIVASTCMIRRDVLEKEGGWDPAIPLEDMYMWFKLTSRGYRMVGLNDVLLYYRKHDSNTYKNVRHMYKSMMKTVSPYRDHALYPQVKMNLLRSYFLKAAKHDRKLAREILKKIPFSAYNKKVWRGLPHLLRP